MVRAKPVYNNCKGCGKPFRVRPSRAHLRLFCSLACRDASYSKIIREGSGFQCRQCGKWTPIRPSRAAVRKFCSVACYAAHASLAKRGPNNPMWKGGVTNLMRAIYASKPLRAWAKQVLIDADGFCERCGNPATEAHHTREVAAIIQLIVDPANGEALCDTCHLNHHAATG